MNLENIMHGEINQKEKGKYCKISLICGIWKIMQMKVYTEQKSRDIGNKIVVIKGNREGGGVTNQK